MKTHDFFYHLPEELIAQTPLEQRDSSRLLKLDRATGRVEHHHFYEIIDELQPGDCLVMNDSRVLPARLLGHRPTGGAVEVLLLRDLGNKCWECLCKPGRKMQVGNEVIFGNGELTATVVEVKDDGNRVVEFHYEGIFLEVLERLGKMPLPPYIKEESGTVSDGLFPRSRFRRCAYCGPALDGGTAGKSPCQGRKNCLCDPARGSGYLPSREGG